MHPALKEEYDRRHGSFSPKSGAWSFSLSSRVVSYIHSIVEYTYRIENIQVSIAMYTWAEAKWTDIVVNSMELYEMG